VGAQVAELEAKTTPMLHKGLKRKQSGPAAERKFAYQDTLKRHFSSGESSNNTEAIPPTAIIEGISQPLSDGGSYSSPTLASTIIPPGTELVLDPPMHSSDEGSSKSGGLSSRGRKVSKALAGSLGITLGSEKNKEKKEQKQKEREEKKKHKEEKRGKTRNRSGSKPGLRSSYQSIPIESKQPPQDPAPVATDSASAVATNTAENTESATVAPEPGKESFNQQEPSPASLVPDTCAEMIREPSEYYSYDVLVKHPKDLNLDPTKFEVHKSLSVFVFVY
jgi:hypothetical protein